MNKQLQFFHKTWLIVAFLTLVVSCSQKKAIRQTAHEFLQLYYVEHNFEAAKALATETSHDNLDSRAQMFALNPNSSSESITNFTVESVEVQKTKAICHYKLGDQTRRLLLNKINDKWLIDIPENVAGIDPSLSLSTSKSESGGFASAESEPIRMGDIPEDKK